MNPNLTSVNLSLSMQRVMMVEWTMKITEKIDGLFSSPDLNGGCCVCPGDGVLMFLRDEYGYGAFTKSDPFDPAKVLAPGTGGTCPYDTPVPGAVEAPGHL